MDLGGFPPTPLLEPAAVTGHAMAVGRRHVRRRRPPAWVAYLMIWYCVILTEIAGSVLDVLSNQVYRVVGDAVGLCFLLPAGVVCHRKTRKAMADFEDGGRLRPVPPFLWVVLAIIVATYVGSVATRF